MPKILTVAGSDSGGGAGIQADLKTFTVLGEYGMSVVTALTAQNTLGVSGIHPVPAGFVADQLEAVLSDIGADGAKCGMLATAETIRVVAQKAKRYDLRPLVVDPVMVAKSGHPLIDDQAKLVLKEKLLPLADLITPNLPEAQELTGLKVNDRGSMIKAAQELKAMGCGAVLVKGGHLVGDPIDVLYDGREVHEFSAPRHESRNTHGTGCTLSAALASFLARGRPLAEAVGQAKDFIGLAIARGLDLGRGQGPTNPLAWLEKDLARGEVLESLQEAAGRLEEARFGPLIPEVSSQLVYALPNAYGVEEVAGFPGRIVKFKGRAKAVGCPAFGASRHAAKVVLAAGRRCPEIRAAMPLIYSEEVLKVCRELGLGIGSFSRTDEPPEVKAREGSSLDWGVSRVFEEQGRCEVIYDLGEVGKEPIIRLLGESPIVVVEQALTILERLRGQGGLNA